MKKILLSFITLFLLSTDLIAETQIIHIRPGRNIITKSTLSPAQQELARKNHENLKRKKMLETFFLEKGYKLQNAQNMAWELSHKSISEQNRVMREETIKYDKKKKSKLVNTTYLDVAKTNRVIDLVIVKKKAHQMELIKNHKVFKRYVVALGKSPVGHKLRRGDNRTPEGDYTLDYKKPISTYALSVHISYPNEQDIKNAKKNNRDPGGMIMIHGQPNSIGYSNDTDKDGEVNVNKFVQPYNWTNGCIALLNADMVEFYNLVEPGTPIRILP